MGVITLENDNMKMRCFRFGTPEGHPFVILPGVALKSVIDLSAAIEAQYSVLAETYDVYVIDRRTNLPVSYSIAEMAEDTAAAMDMLAVENAVVYGVSQGGMIAQEIALRRPELVRKLILRQFANLRLDPYANAFYADEKKEGEWKDDMTDMKPGLHERKYEIDSLCYPIRLAHGYWKASGDATVFSGEWENTLRIVLRTFREQQRKDGQETAYRFQRLTKTPVDTLGNSGRGNPVRPVGLIASAFRPSDDATILPFLVPSNFFAVDVLRKSLEILKATGGSAALAKECDALADEVHEALMKHAVVDTEKWGRVYAFEVDGYGGHILMDDANAPSLLSLPYLCGIDRHDPVYMNTRRMILSPEGNPYCFRGKALEGIGSPHTGLGKVWPMSLIMRILTSEDDDEIRAAMKMLVDTTAGTGFMHESVNADDPADFTRSWFAWANTLFGEVILELVERGKADLL